MADEIIINGIDVSRCEYRDWQNFCHCDNSKENEGEKRVTGRGNCKYNPNCHFKQLKRKEKECENSKKEIAFGNNGKLSDKIRVIDFKNLNDENSKYKQTFDEIEKFCKQNHYCLESEDLWFPDEIQGIINKGKRQKNAHYKSKGAKIKLLEVYTYGFLGLFKIMFLILLELILLIVLVITIPLWGLKHIQKLLSNFGDVIAEVLNW